MTATIRSATVRDRDAILTVVREAFSGPTRDGQEEVDIVTETWRRQGSPEGFDLVAEDEGAVVGHVMAAVGDLEGAPALGVAPLCVAPHRQGQGVGSALMGELLDRIEAAGWPFALLLGDPRYYRRFGFEPAAGLGLVYPPVGPDDPHFMVRDFSALPVRDQARFRYCWELRR